MTVLFGMLICLAAIIILGLTTVQQVTDMAVVPTSLPRRRLPDSSLMPTLFANSVALAIIDLVQDARDEQGAYPNPDGNYPNPSHDFVGQCVANIGDDHTMVRSGLKHSIYGFEWMEPVDEVRNGGEAVAFCATHAVDVVLMDMMMPATDGSEATRCRPDVGFDLTDRERESLVLLVQGFMYLLYLPLSFMIASSSGLATVARPIMAPLAQFPGVPSYLVTGGLAISLVSAMASGGGSCGRCSVYCSS